MTDTYINLVNKVLKPFNEVQLNVSNFSIVSDGFHQHAKDTINDAIYDICIYEDCLWPFLWSVGTVDTLTDGTIEYSLNANAIAVKWNSFRLQRNDVLEVDAIALNELDYDVYNKVYRSTDVNTGTNEYGIPRRISRTPNNKLIISPPSDKIYTLEYEFFSLPAPLVEYDDTTVIPLPFNQLIIDRALHYLHMFRGDAEMAMIANNRFETNIANMKRILIRRSNIMIPIQ